MSIDNMIEKTVTVNGQSIFYAEIGDGPVVLLLHGGGPGASGVSNYSRNIVDLAEHFRVIVPDLPGYGQSSKGVDQTDPFGYLADAIRGLLDVLGIHRAHLVGNSYGGACALRLALDSPDRVERMILMGPGGIGTTRGLPTPGLQSLLSYYTGTGPSHQKLENFIRQYLVFDGESVPSDVIDMRYHSSIDPDVVADPPLRRPSGKDALKTMWRMDFTRDKRLATLDIPTLVIWGAADKVNKPAGGKMLADRMPHCDVLTVAQTGHWVQWERAPFFNSVTRVFLNA
ncbi:alpha/beta fold hydrolase [Rhodococcus sp. NPDC056743]|uniref:alpha/beta fold hydrolase n=1 Tax=Rhodococcus sp. NPDC056743 TaxID=3345934 RepID=UPI0036722273